VSKKNSLSIQLGSPGEVISKKDLHAIRRRFKNLNQQRLKRVNDFLQPQQNIFLSLLPLLVHQNEPFLPGFVPFIKDEEKEKRGIFDVPVPIGIPDYTPDKETLLAAKKLSKTYKYRRKALPSYPIQGIYLMGSLSSIAFSKTSDIDIWLCHQPDLDKLRLDKLQQKCTKIEQWAAELNLEVHFFLVNSEQFAKGENIPLSEESSGSTQHYLLLEEFYRTAIFIAGRIPAWWLIPPNQELNYTGYLNHLLKHRFIASNDIIDFGGLASVPAEEFASATLWHIYKSVTSPHKSLLKLFLMEAYASEYPHPEWLSFKLKQSIYQGFFDIDELDPYVLIYTKVDQYLQSQQSRERLELARQCFYLKVMGTSSKYIDGSTREQREKTMKTIASQWNWPDQLLSSLNEQQFWDIKKAIQEHIIVRKQLKQCLQIIHVIAGQYINASYRNNHELKLISRRLSVALEKKPGKVEVMTTRSSIHRKEPELAIVEMTQGKTHYWALYSQKNNINHQLIKQDSHLLRLLAWLIINRLYDPQVYIEINSHSINLSRAELSQMLKQLDQFIANNLNEDRSLQVYHLADKLTASLTFVNLGHFQTDQREDDGMMVISDRSDPLSYGKNRLCFVQKIDKISISAWGEVMTSQHEGLDELFNCFCRTFNNGQLPILTTQHRFVCYTPSRANSIVLRLETVFAQLVKLFADPESNQNNRYILPGERSTYIFQKINQQLHYWKLDSTEQLLQELAKVQPKFCQLHFDSNSLDDKIIPFLYQSNQANIVQVYVLIMLHSVTVYIIDEKGALFIQEHKQSNHHQVLSHYSLFLESVLNHSVFPRDIQLRFYQIQQYKSGDYVLHPANWTPSIHYMDLSLQIVQDNVIAPKPTTNYYIYCNDIEFNSVEYGDKLFEEVSNYIFDCRKNKESYPIHISNIDAPYHFFGVNNESELQTVLFLNYKRKLEIRLNTE